MRWILLGLIWLVACQAPPQPNIVLIMADDLGYETLTCNGGSSYQTPQLDAMASEGMRFTQCYATPLCTPSRVQLMTGRYNFRNYIGFGLLDPEETTFAQLLQQAGYRTGIAGKWQLYGNAHQRELAGRGGSRPEEAGFDSHCLWQVADRGFRYKSPTLEYSDQSLQTHPEGYGPDLFWDYIRNFMEESKDQPFFLYYPMCLTHDPFLPSPQHPDFEGHDPEVWMNDTSYFGDMLNYTDKQVGRILDHLDELGLAEETLVIFIGDNGTDRKVISRMGTERIKGHKGYPTSAGTHVPMIAWWPGKIAFGSTSDQLVDLTDFLPTLLDLAQVSPPEDLVLDGHSLLPELLHQQGTGREWVFCHYDPRWGKFTPSRMVHDRAWKLYGDGSFYHVAEDPLEQAAVPDALLSPEILSLKASFQAVLDGYAQP